MFGHVDDEEFKKKRNLRVFKGENLDASQDKTVDSLDTKRNAEDAQDGLVTMDTISHSDVAMRRGRRGSHDGIVTMDTIPHPDGIGMDTISHRSSLADENARDDSHSSDEDDNDSSPDSEETATLSTFTVAISAPSY